MGQPYDASGLPSQRALPAQFSTMPSTDGPSLAAPSSANPLSAQGVSNQVYGEVKNRLANPNADAFGSLPAVAPAAANALGQTQSPNSASSAENPLTEMFDPKYAIPGIGIGLGVGYGLNRLYDNGGERLVKILDKLPGSKLGGANSSAWSQQLVNNRSPEAQRRLKLALNRLDVDQAAEEARLGITQTANKHFGNNGFSRHFEGNTLRDLNTQLETIHSQRKALTEGPIKRGFKMIGSRLGFSEEPIGHLFDVDAKNGTVTLKNGKTPTEKQREAIKKAFGGNTIEEAIGNANKPSKELFEALKKEGYTGDFKTFSKKLRGVAAYTKGQSHLILGDGKHLSQYAEHLELTKRLNGYNPVIKVMAKSGYYLKRAFNMESSLGSGPKGMDKIVKFLGPGMIGAMTFGLAAKEASKGETKKDKFKLGARELLSGTIANLAAFELFMHKGRLFGLEKVMGKFAFKSFLGTRFSWVGTLISMGLALGFSSVLTSFMNKGFDAIFGKARTKEDAEKEKQAATGAATPQQAIAPTASQTAQAIDPNVANDPTLNQLATQLTSNDSASAPAQASSAPSPSGNDAYIRQSDITNGLTTPFKLPSSQQPISLDDIRYNPLADKQSAMAG